MISLTKELQYLDKITTIGLVKIACVDGGGGRVPSRVGFAVVKIFCFDDLVNRFALTNMAERVQFRGERSQHLHRWEAADCDICIAISSHGILM